MPELPEVETTKKSLEPIIGLSISKLLVHQPKLRYPVDTSITHALIDCKITSITRRSKYLLFELCLKKQPKGYLIAHLGMSGSLRIENKSLPVKKHDHIELYFKNSKVLRYNDPRRFGCLLWHPNKTLVEVEQTPLLKSLGPEPLTEAFDTKHLKAALAKRQIAIKPAIMDSKVVVGVGNIYAAESLFLAGISPKRPANKVSTAKLEKLTQAIKSILAQAIEQGGSTINDYVNGEGKPGYFQQTLQVYGKEDEPCHHCQAPIKRFTQAQRSTFYCNKCQR